MKFKFNHPAFAKSYGGHGGGQANKKKGGINQYFKRDFRRTNLF